jgi:hypothetical protein
MTGVIEYQEGRTRRIYSQYNVALSDKGDEAQMAQRQVFLGKQMVVI